MWQTTGVRQRLDRAYRPLCPALPGAGGGRMCWLSGPVTSAPSFLWPPAWSWRFWPWDFPSLLPEVVTHKAQGICPESPFFRLGLGTQTWGTVIPRQFEWRLAQGPSSLCFFPTEGSSQITVSNMEDPEGPGLAHQLKRGGRQPTAHQPALSQAFRKGTRLGLRTLWYIITIPNPPGPRYHSWSPPPSPLVRPGTLLPDPFLLEGVVHRPSSPKS